MLISYKWIQTYFDKPLPEPDVLANLLTMHAFELEGVEKKTTADGEYEDTIFDLKVLPDRAPFALSHRYMAEEIGALTRYDVKWPEIAEFTEKETSRSLEGAMEKTVEENKLCYRIIHRIIENITVGESPFWLRHRLEVLGQRSINSVVDLTNYIGLECGEPTHAFDADKVEGKIEVRLARPGEEVELLNGVVIKLTPETLVIADELGPLDVAGIKGGKRAEITAETKNIIIEAGCFNRTNIRRTSQLFNLRTDSSKRFENGVTPERAGLGMAMLTSHLASLNPDAIIGEALDIYPHQEGPVVIEVRIADIYQRLGVHVPEDRMIDILTRLNIEVEEGRDTLKLGIPPYRPDLRIAEDIAEEVGRIYGYDKVLEKVPEPRKDRKVNKNFHYFNLIRKTLAEAGFSEVYTYSLVDNGDMAIQNPLTVERSHMRNSILDLLPSKFLFNMRNADILGLKEIKMFEIGKIFGNKKERFALAFGFATTKLPKGVDAKTKLTAIFENVAKALNASKIPEIKWAEIKGDAQTPCVGLVAEIELEDLISSLPEPKEDVDMASLTASITDGRKFKAISQYPFSARDVAVFVPGEEGKENEVLQTIFSALDEEQKKLLVRMTLFDVFTKQGADGALPKTSYAYRLIFQANDRTLTQEEVENAMKAITSTLSSQSGWEVR
jgi:phenylalanyl-tRNA synthetase beta chain